MSSNPEFWKRKLAAYLHDPPEKVLDLAWHKKRAEAQQNGQDLDDVVFTTAADHTAAAADRLPWPTYRHLACSFDGAANHFKHPLGQAALKIEPFATADLATDSAWKSRPVLDRFDGGSGIERARFFAFWRLWRWWASDLRHPKDPRMAFLPADSRLPDHTIWAHNSLVSAFEGCVEDGKCRPAFLLFQIGPVQEFIAAARRTLDLWSGSYLLSYLTANALKHVALTLGPDQVIFPNLCGQPLFDLMISDDIWTKAFIKKDGEQSLWESFGYEKDYARRRLLTPSLPNRFLALVPAGQADRIARDVEAAVRKKWREIADAVWRTALEKIDPIHPLNQWEERFHSQVNRHLEIAWQTLPWPAAPADGLKSASRLPGREGAEGLDTILRMAREMPKDHRDVRNFECPRFSGGPKKGWKDKTQIADEADLDNPGAAWSVLYSLLNWQLDAVRQNRGWEAWEKTGEDAGLMNEKDSLTGKEEAVLNLASGEIDDDLVKKLSSEIGPAKLFKKGEILGAITLIKRLWPTAWLMSEHDFKASDFRVPDTRKIADAQPFDESTEAEDEAVAEKSYFAVLAFDGDEMGKWVAGTHENLPTLGDLLADYEEGSERKGARVYFENHPSLKSLLSGKRPLNPSFHLQFSEMLGTFSNVCARRVVEAFDGYLVYSGGDDVLALVPADRALACAHALRAAFRGTADLNETKGAWEVDREYRHREKKGDLPIFQVRHEGFVQLHPDNYLVMEGEPKNFPAIVPGPATDCSVGVAIAHFKSPLQDVVRAAQAAEKRAKRSPEQGGLGRAAVAVSLFKRSGEIVEWGFKWESQAHTAHKRILDAMRRGVVSAKFPHRIVDLIRNYETGDARVAGAVLPADGFDDAIDEVLRLDVKTAAERQRGPEYDPGEADEIAAVIGAYVAGLSGDPQRKVRDLIGLCQTVAFASRTSVPSRASDPLASQSQTQS